MRISCWCSDVCSSDLKSPVPRAMSQLVVKRLEIVDVGDNHGQVPSMPARIGDDHGGRFLQTTPIQHAGQRVPRDQSTQLLSQIACHQQDRSNRSEEHTSELQSLMRISYAVFCLNKKKPQTK